MNCRSLVILAFVLAISLPVRGESGPSLGWIPMQFIEPGREMVVDLRRFCDPAGKSRIEFAQPREGVEATYDSERMELRIKVSPEAKGIVPIPLRLVGKDSKVLKGILAVAVQAPGDVAQAPSVFAAGRTGSQMVFETVSSVPLASASVVAQLPDGTSSVHPAQIEEGAVTVSTKDLPAGSWIRVAVIDEAGRVSKPARALVGAEPSFQWQDGIIYYAFTDRFVNGDPANDRPVRDTAVLPLANYLGGDFNGIRQRIDDGYFSKLGINVLWLAPLNRNPDDAWKEYLPPYRSYTGYHGYWPVSHTEVEPRFGGDAALREMVESAQRSGVRIIADLVLRHTHAEHPLWSEKREWFGKLELPDGRKNLRIWDEHQFTTWFEEWLPGFDFDNPEPVSFLLSNAAYWAETYQLDGFRLDAVKHIKPDFWWKFRTAMRRIQDPARPMYFVGETFMDRQGIMQFVGPNMLDGQFDFPLYDTIMEVLATQTQGFGDLEASLALSETIYGKETLMSPLVGNHDKSRFMAFADGDLPDSHEKDEEEVGWVKPPQVDNPASYERLKLALSFILAIDGVPMVYYGDEVGLTGAGDPDNRRMMPRDEDLKPEQIAVRDHLGKVARLRLAHPALRYGHRRMLVAEETRYAFVRRHFDDRIVAIWNRGAEPAAFELNVSPELADGDYRDEISGAPVKVEGGWMTLKVAPMSAALIVPVKKTVYR